MPDLPVTMATNSSIDGSDPEIGNPLRPAIHHTGLLLSRSERVIRGRERRQVARRSSHGSWVPPTDRPDPLRILKAQNRNRYPELIPLRWGRMVASPFAFFRGAAAVMASDLSTTPITGLSVQACGDAHLQNFGLFASPERNLLFDVNDFDETIPGPWEWDIKRLAASIVLAGRDAGLSEASCSEAVMQSVGVYRMMMGRYAQMSQLEVWYSRVDIDTIIPLLPPEVRPFGLKIAEKARRRDTMQAMTKMTEVVDGRRRIVDDPPIIEHLESSTAGNTVQVIVDRYRQTLADERRLLFERFELVDVARKAVGVGSVGTHCHIALCTADAEDDDPLFLQIKEANHSVLEPYVGKSLFANQGQRVVVGQRYMQAASDLFLGWTKYRNRDFYVRQLRDMKSSIDLTGVRAPGLSAYSALCGWTLARAHARSGDPVAISAYLGAGDSFDRALVTFSSRYADQTEVDHSRLRAAIDSGALEAIEGR
ncbi:unannotated protein [freshwater metagenome]|uniref:Unannotated protein n=2 Tax=freshwater metagenome TaxID=449393 RepID=A0A6J7HWX8_9ZZZZ